MSDRANYLFLDLNSFFASVEQQKNPALRGKPVAVIPTDTEATCAIAASYEAKAYGIKTGTMIYEAKKKCPDLICVLGSHEDYLTYHERVLEAANDVLPISEVWSIDEFCCRLMRNEQPLDVAIEIAERMKRTIRERVGECIGSSVGLAPNRYLAKIASGMQKPDGLTVLTPDNLEEKLLTLELMDVHGIGHNMHRRLLEHGVGNMRQLLALSPKHMRKIWHNVAGEKNVVSPTRI